jgi:hypothetical protein
MPATELSLFGPDAPEMRRRSLVPRAFVVSPLWPIPLSEELRYAAREFPNLCACTGESANALDGRRPSRF